jgi:hypothetical protein
LADNPSDNANLQNLASIQLQGVKNLGLLIQAIQAAFIQFGGTATTATGGATIALPTHPVGYVTATLPNGSVVKIAYYNE